MPSRTSKSMLLAVFVGAISLSYGFSDWDIYRRKLLGAGDAWKMYLHGGIDAPWQYRIGPWLVVDWMDRLFHARPHDTLTLIDVLCLALALWTMLVLIRKSERYRSASSRTRWLALAGALFIAEYYLAWAHWYQTSVTMPSILFVMLSMALIDRRILHSKLLNCLLLVALGCIQGFIRADVAVVLHSGIFLAIVFNRKTSVPLGRVRQAATSLLTAAIAGCVQLYLMFIKFPRAKYDAGGVVRLSTNVHPGMWLVMLLGLFPFCILLGLAASRRYRTNGPELLLLTSSVLYLALWATVGLLDEVRIFLPFAFALIPATTMALIGQLPDRSHSYGQPTAT